MELEVAWYWKWSGTITVLSRCSSTASTSLLIAWQLAWLEQADRPVDVGGR